MKKIYLLTFLFLIALGSFGQSILDPTDTIITYNPTNPPVQPAPGQIGKWVRTKRLSWNTSEYKSYIYKGNPFRLHFPKSYNPTANDGKKYPLLIFFHGLGETDTSIYDNEYQLYHGGQNFQTAVDNGTYDGYVLFMQTSSFWTNTQFQAITDVIDYMIANNKLDPFATSVNGISAGGQGTWDMLFSHPTYVAADIPMSSISISYANQENVNMLKFTPVWDVQGGQDQSPAAYTAEQVRNAMIAAGANFTYTEYPTQGHDTWDSTWLLPQFYTYIDSAYSSNPWTLFGRTKFCPGDNINVTIGLTPGYQAYQWRFNNNLISGATTNSIQATQAGKYDARVERNGIWSDWSRIPVQIIIQSPSPTPPIQVAGLMSTAIPAADGKNYVNLQVSGNGIYTSYTWKKVGSDSIYSTQPVFQATQPGYYTVAALPQYGCSALNSPTYKVIDANGGNAPNAVKSLVVNPLSNTKVQLSWSLPAQQVNVPTALEIYRGTASGAYAFIAQVAPSVKNYTDSSLSPKVKYFYAIRAIDSTGASPLSNEASTSTYSDTTAPSIPANLKVTYTTTSAISISWTASTDNVAVDHYNIYVNGILSNITKQTTFTLTGLTQSQPYAIYVTAVDSSNNVSSKSNQVTAEPILGGLQYSYYTTAVPWKILPDFESLTPTTTGVSKNISLSVAKQSNLFGILWQGYIQVPVSGTYTFQITSDDGSALWFNSYTPTGKRLISNDGAHGAIPKQATINITAGIYPICVEYFQDESGKSINLSWASSALFGDTVQRTITDNYFNGTYNNAGTAPLAPTNFAATAIAFDKINLSWQDNSSNETGFEIYRSQNANGIFNIVGTTAANATSYTDSLLAPVTTYFYKIQAINKYGNSGLSKLDSVNASGVSFNYYVGNWTSVPNFAPLTASGEGVSPNFTLTGGSGNGYGFLFQGKINIPISGAYTFYTTSGNGSNLYIDGYSGNNAVVKNVFSSTPHEQSGTINLTQGIHTIFVAYYYNASGNNGGASLNVSYQGPFLSKQTIPTSVLTYQTVLSSAVTFALPAAPSAPANFTATATSASKISLAWNSVSGATGYQLFRSISDTNNYNLLTRLPSNATSYSDSALNANLKHYYKLQATGLGGTLSTTSTANATTKDNVPVLTKLNNTSVPYSTATIISLIATDADDDILTYTGSNLPAFASISSNGKNSASLVINPSSANLGTYPNIKIVVKDAFGGSDSTIFTLTVNSNYIPTIDTIASYTLNENDTLSLYLNAHDQNSGDILKWSASNLPNASVLTDLGNGKAKIFFHPNYLAAGTYNPVITVNDGKGGITTRTFNLIVNDVNPNTNLYVRFKNVDTIGSPWNNVTSVTTNNLVDLSGKATNIGLALQTGWFSTSNAGPVTGNNSGIYPDAVLKDYYYFGNNGGPSSVTAKITGLSLNKNYNLTFFGASNYSGYSDNGSTVYTIGSISDTLAVQNNISKTVTISNIIPDSTGTITFTMSKGVNTANGYINALVISSIYNDGTLPLAATSLAAQNIAGRGVQLTWKDVAYNEQGYRIYRALSYNGVYSLVGTTQSEATSFIDTSVNGNTQYSYKIRTFNANGGSTAYSNIVTITTLDKIPTITAISDVILKSNQTATVNITAKDDATDHLALSVSNLPPFATFTDNGNGTGKITISPSANDQGNFLVTVTATDKSDSSVSTAFNILVSDPKVSSTYLSFSDGAHSVPKPWNVIGNYPFAGASYNNLTDDSNTPTGITLTLKNGFQGVAETGMQPVDGVGIYPNSVMRPGFFEGNAVNDTIQLSGLSSSKAYNFVFFNSHDDGLNCTTNFTVNGKTVTQNASGNLYKTIQINGIIPDATGVINIIVSKDSAASYAFITTLIIQSYDSVYKNISPTNLRITKITRSSVNVTWQDRASTETGYQIWRAVNGANSYTLLTTVAAGVKNYTDANLTADNTYRYSVRGVFGSSYSNFSNSVTATTYSYNVYVNFTASSDALLPWNNLDAPPQIGYTWSNFFDEKGFITGIGMQLNTEWAGVIAGGVQPAPSNTGIYPNAVMADSYGLFPGQSATFKVTGLNLNMKYDFTFFASSSTYADINVAYTINGVTTLLDASLNVNGTQTIYGVTPDSYGNVTITVAPGTGTSLFGLIGAMVIGGYTPSVSKVIPTLPQSQQGFTRNAIAAGTQNHEGIMITNKTVQAFPNPFHDYFTLSVPAENSDSKIQVLMYDVTGKIVYSNQFTNVNAGMNSLNITPVNNLANGIYTVIVINGDAKKAKTIKLVRQ